MAPGPIKRFISEQVGVACVTAAQLTVPATAVNVTVQADGQDVRYTLDGTSPTASSGILLPKGTSTTMSATDAAAAKFIQTTATALLNAIYSL